MRPIDPAAVRIAALKALMGEIATAGDNREFRFAMATGEPVAGPPERAFAAVLLAGYGVVGLCAMSDQSPREIRGALVDLAMGATSPSWDREY